MESFMSAIGAPRAKSARDKAQDVMYQAWDQAEPSKRIALANKALTISPLCADAYVLLAEEKAKSAKEALEYYRKGLDAGSQALGTKAFNEYAGHFWGFLETRPYMRARAGLAATLDALGDVEASIGHYRDMLRLNPGDNQGIRYLLARCFMKSRDIESLRQLLKQFDEDGTGLWLYTRALISFRDNGAEDKTAAELARKACKANRHVPAVLAGAKAMKSSMNGYLTIGGEDEAAHYVDEWGFDWVTTPGAVDWLTKIAADMASTQMDRRSMH
jgi:tetratricopeptide (TPR) repeat protein